MKKILLNFLLTAMIAQENVLAKIDDQTISVKIKSYNDNGLFYVVYLTDKGKQMTYIGADKFLSHKPEIYHYLIRKKINKQGLLKFINVDEDRLHFKHADQYSSGKLLQMSDSFTLEFNVAQTDENILYFRGVLILNNNLSKIMIDIHASTINKFISKLLHCIDHANEINAEEMRVSAKDFLKSK